MASWWGDKKSFNNLKVAVIRHLTNSPAQGGKGGKPPRFVAKAAAGSGSAKDAARAEHLAKVRGAPMATGGATTGSATSRLANKPLLPPAEPAPRSKGVRTE